MSTHPVSCPVPASSPARDVPAGVRYPLTRGFIESVRRVFDMQGFIVIEDALSAVEIGQANGALDQLATTGELPERSDLRPVVDKSPLFLDHIDNPRVLPYLLAIVGGNLQVMLSTCTVVPPGAGPMVWHEDGPRPWSYPAVDGRRAQVFARMGYFLEDLTEPDRGNLVLVPGSHQMLFHKGGPPRVMDAMPNLTTLRARAGSAVIFHQALWHRTAPNRMDHARRVLYYAFAPCWHRVVDYVTPPDHLLAMIDDKPVERQGLLRQLVGAVPPQGANGFFFPDERTHPGLALVEPEHPASGY